MADITMCMNDGCPDRDNCYRATATPNEHWQSMAMFKYTLGVDGVICDDKIWHFMAAKVSETT